MEASIHLYLYINCTTAGESFDVFPVRIRPRSIRSLSYLVHGPYGIYQGVRPQPGRSSYTATGIAPGIRVAVDKTDYHPGCSYPTRCEENIQQGERRAACRMVRRDDRGHFASILRVLKTEGNQPGWERIQIRTLERVL